MTTRCEFGVSLAALIAAAAALFAPPAAAQGSSLGRIAYGCGASSNFGYSLCAVNPDGSNPVTLVSAAMTQYPAWSPDGSKIAFSIATAAANQSIYTINADGTNLTQITVNNGQFNYSYAPTWSKDGSEIFFTASPGLPNNGLNLQIWRVSSNGGSPTQFTNDPGMALYPAMSSDGTRLAYSNGQGVWIMNMAGGAAVKIGTGDFPAWSPDGRQIAVRDANGIFVMNADGTGRRQVASGPVSARPTWSPDGGRIAFVAANTSVPQITIVNANGAGAATAIGPGVWPSWQSLCAGAGGDSDGDGLCDDWERNGLTVTVKGQPEFVDLPKMGADPMHKDVFIQADSMCCTDDHRPHVDAVALVADAFANAPVSNPDGTFGINLHVDCGSFCIMNPKTGETWGALSAANLLEHQDQIGSVDSRGNYLWDDFDQIKQANFSDARKPVFHYVVFAHNLGGMGSTSGLSRDITASDFIVSLGSWTNQVGTTLEQAGTLMHELGHNLSLQHGGSDSINYKPNYLSVMNYTFQTGGLIINGSSGTFDYSRFTLPALNELNLNESIGINIGGASTSTYGTEYFCPAAQFSLFVPNANNPIDWNCNSKPGESAVIANINGDKSSSEVLNSFTDWPTLVFRGGSIGQLGSTTLPSATPDLQELTPELDARITKPLRVNIGGPGIVQAAAGSSIDLAFTITNTGTQADSYTLSTNASVAWANLTGVPASVTLNSGASIHFTIRVTVPAGTAGSASGQFSIRARSRTAPLIQDSRSTTVVVPTPGAPLTVASLNPPPNADGGNTGNVTVTLSASAATGIKSITYSATGAQTIAATVVNGSTASFTITAAGLTTISFFSRDNAGSVEIPETLTVRIGPVIDQGGVVNGGSFDPLAPIAPGMIVSIFGTGLAPGNTLASDIPLPLSLNNVSVTINGEQSPLYFVSSRQINVQAPWDLDTSKPAQVVVNNNNVSSSPEPAQTLGVSPAVLAYLGHAIAINNADGDLAAAPGLIPGLTTHPVARGDAILLYATGLGAVDHDIAKGGIPASGTLVYNNVKPTILLNGTAIPDADVIFWGLTPQFVGVNQINVIIPPDAPTGDSVSIQISTSGLTSPASAATLAIQ